MGLIQLGTFTCHFAGKVPFVEITQILGADPTYLQRCTFCTFIAFMTLLRLVFAAYPMCRSIAQFSAIVHWIEFFPITYLAVVNIFLRYESISQLHLAGGAALVAFSFLNAAIFYNYWMDRLTGEIRSTSVSLARAGSAPAVAAIASVSTAAAKKLAPPARASAKKTAAAASPEASESPAKTRKSSTPAARKSASPKKRSATPKKAASKTRGGSKKRN
jgi:hypothetical protein